ncbi:MAG: DUF2341 domain-containing protein, partial [Candidatus Hodarchaeota archaeon]
MVTRTYILRSMIFCVFLINLCSFAISLQEENFLESDHIAAEFFRGMGFKGKIKEEYHPVPILSKYIMNKGQADELNTGGLHFKKSQYFIPGWADTRWEFRKNITISASKVSADLINFPVYIDLYDTDLPQDAQASGNDIFFTDIQGNLLDHEIELYERVYNSSHAHLVAWLKANISSTQNTVLSMYYGNPIAENQENPTAVWAEDYVGVWHLNEESGNTQDSTSFGTSGGITGGVTQNIPTQLGRGYDFDGTVGTTVNFGDPIDGHLDFGTNSFTVSLWVNIDQSTGDYQIPLYKGGSSNSDDGYEIETTQTGDSVAFYSGDGTTTYECGWFGIEFDTWYYIVGVNDRVTDYIRIYQDGVNMDSVDISSLGSVDSADHLVLSHNSYEIDGMIDEVRLSKTIRSSAWIQTEYNNQKDPSTFYSISTKENYEIDDEWALPALKYRKNVTILATQVSGSGNLVDFPVLVNLYDIDLHNSEKVQADGDDIIFVDASGTILDHEIELFNQDYNTSHAKLVAWIRIPSLSGLINTTISMYYGNPILESQQNPSGVWDS